MLTAHALDLVQLHRSRIDDQLETAVGYLRIQPETARLPLATARWRMLQMLRHYHLFKRIEIFEPAMHAGSADLRRQALRMLEACQAGWHTFADYTLDWSSRDVVEVWPDYVVAMQAMAERVHAHVAGEQALIHELLAGSQRIHHRVH